MTTLQLISGNLSVALQNIASFFTPDPSVPLVLSSGAFWLMFLAFLPILRAFVIARRR